MVDGTSLWVVKAHKTNFCPPAVLHKDSSCFPALIRWWRLQGVSRHAFCHVTDHGEVVPTRPLRKSTVERWLRTLFKANNITGITLHGLRAAGLMYQILRGVSPMFSALQGHWSLQSQQQFSYSRFDAHERLEYYSSLPGHFA